jgi:molybdopterin synthase catalytic subunit
MQIRVLFFGLLRDLVGRESDLLDLPEEATLADVLTHYGDRIPKLKSLLPRVALSVNQEYAGPEVRLKADDEVALLPPVSGGTEAVTHSVQQERSQRCASIVRDKIDPEQVLARVKHPEDGAAVVFEGVVRNHSRGRQTLYLDYEAYEEMALKQMESLAEQALAKFQIRDVAMVHRLGRLDIGETSVLIVVVSAHRAPAFDACRWLIDTLKRTVPIWKKEHFADGAVWSDGEPFPAEIQRAQGTPSAGTASK